MKLEPYNAAGYPILWLLTQDPARVIRECTATKAHWDAIRGLSLDLVNYEEADPLSVVERAASLQKTVLFLENFNHYLEAPAVAQAVLNAVPRLKSNGSTLVILSPVLKIPPELSALVRVLDHDLPSDEAYVRCLEAVLPAGMTLTDEQKATLVKAGSGMTLSGFEDAVALSLVEHQAIQPDVIWKEKADQIRKEGGAEIYQGSERFDDIGGLEGLKRFCLRSLTSGRKGARGVLLLGCPGTGKSMFAKALGKEVERCTISLDLGRMFCSLVGESERMMRETLKVVDRMEPSVLFIDEIEKGLSGIQSSGKTDGGTGSRIFGTLLTWLNDHKSETYVVATCNDISQIPPEFLRQERWDGIFFVDLPAYEERERIWELYKKQYGLSGKHPENLAGWTGAEIKSACRLAHIQGIALEESVTMTIPLMASAGSRIEEIRKKASGRCLSAETGGIYRCEATPAATGRRIASMN